MEAIGGRVDLGLWPGSYQALAEPPLRARRAKRSYFGGARTVHQLLRLILAGDGAAHELGVAGADEG